MQFLELNLYGNEALTSAIDFVGNLQEILVKQHVSKIQE